VETRCVELGAECKCSEPLDFQATGISGIFDPPDSEGPGAKECNVGKSIDTNGPQQMVLASSAGLPGPLYVFRAVSGASGVLKDEPRVITQGTYCLRSYARWAADFPGPTTSDQNVKGPRNTNPSGAHHPGFQSEWGFNASGDAEFSFAADGSSVFGTTLLDVPLKRTQGAGVKFSGCRESWCRIEYCVDHGWDGSQRIQWRGRVTRIDTGAFGVYGPEPSLGSNPIAFSGTASFVAMWFTAGLPSGADAFYSHGMVAIRAPADPSFWIGRAVEIEGEDPCGLGC
jgi:hypothetical protein